MYNNEDTDIIYENSYDSYSLWNSVELPRHTILTITNIMMLFQSKRT